MTATAIEFDAVLAHRMLNSLNVLSGVLHVLDRHPNDLAPSEVRELCDLANAHAERMADALRAVVCGDPAAALGSLVPCP